MASTSRVRVPPYSVEDAVRLYTDMPNIRREHIIKLFHVCESTAGKLKKLAEEKMREKGMSVMDSCSVNIDAAYEAWGIDINDLMRRQQMRDRIDCRRGREAITRREV